MGKSLLGITSIGQNFKVLYQRSEHANQIGVCVWEQYLGGWSYNLKFEDGKIEYFEEWMIEEE